MKSLSEILESKSTAKEITNYVSNWLNECSDLMELKVYFGSIIDGLNKGLAEYNKYAKDEESVEVCERASEIIEQFEDIVNTTLKDIK